MPRSRPRRRLRRSLQSEAAATLGRDLALIPRTSTHAFDRRSRRLAFAFATTYGDELPDGPVVLSELRLVALGHRLCDDGLGGIRGRAPLVVLRPEIDFAIDGRVRFVPDIVFDLATRGPAAGPVRRLDHPRRTELGRLAVALHQAIEDAGRSGTVDVLTLPRFSWAFRPDSPPPLADSELTGEFRRIGGLRAWPAERFLKPSETEAGIPAPPTAVPEAIYADAGHLRGRAVRNPAFGVLRRAGLIPARLEYSRRLASMGLGAPDSPASPRAELMARIEAYAASSSSAQSGLLSAVRAGCEAAGIAIPADSEEALRFLAELLTSPWSTPVVAAAGTIQVVRLPGPPGSGSSRFSGELASLDLEDLGAAYEPLDPADVAEALRQRRRTRRPMPA